MNSFEVGDPYIEWQEENSAIEPRFDEAELEEQRIEGAKMEDLKEAVVKLLISDHDFDIEEAAEKVEASVVTNADMWNENAEVRDLANYLASDESDD